ncbi:response regulator transcription factor [Desulfatibacillum aliphaticivorans]|uniref:response regulator transcription factor n=1 Tax=Desulfatibacillum aliphaticivorans TaxID=218208 RepID=UPI00042742F5|nr:response regulator transcription factor [Desulfatibacillum aliphaticivorans]
MAKAPTIMVVDDDAHIREVVGFALKKEGFQTIQAKDGLQAVKMFAEAAPDLVILDILMPEMDGTEVCKKIRADSDVPIIFLSSKDDEIDRILGLELGGDDYVTKPFSPRELIARVKARLRRRLTEAKPAVSLQEKLGAILEKGRLRLDVDAHIVSWDSVRVELTHREFRILQTLMGYPEKIFTREELIDGAYGRDHFVSDRTIDSHIKSVRKKLAAVGGEAIRTAHGVGYQLGECT